MKLFLAALALIFATAALADTHVKGYYKKNGTYVEPHYRSSPNGTTNDNYSTKGNVNPYTGQEGTRNPEPNQLNGGTGLQLQGIEPTKTYGSY
jgi:hypothetical protein